jgi:UDP-N-acetylmuramoyl-tripeptide--D-alanyl-D-alanine ligase
MTDIIAPDRTPAASPPEMTAHEVAVLTGGRLRQGDPRAVICGAGIDSRTIAPGMLFVALAGERTDGHRFAGEAIRRGAAAALVSRDVPEAPKGSALIEVPLILPAFQRLARALRDRRPLRVVGITGSVGKTSTKEMAAAVAARVYRTAGSPENWNTEIGIPLVLTNMPRDREVAVVELAMRGPGQIRELAEICRPEIGVITIIGESHMDFFDSREALAAAKGELLDSLPAGGVAIVNADDPLAVSLARRGPARLLLFGLGGGDVTAEDVRTRGAQGSTFRLRVPGGSADVVLPVPGRHAVSNALAAAAVGVALDVPAAEIARGLAQARPLPMRLEVRATGPFTVVNDVYNSSPQSVEAALDVMDEIAGSPRIAVLGDMKELGGIAPEAHRRMGRAAARRGLDLLVAFGPLAAELAAGAREAGASRVVHTTDLAEAIAVLLRALAPGAVVLVKGSRAMMMERVVVALDASVQAPPSAGSASPPAGKAVGRAR